MLLMVSKVWKQKRNSRVLAVVLAIGSIVLGRVGKKVGFGWKDRVEDDHSSDGTVQPARSGGGNSIPVHSM